MSRFLDRASLDPTHGMARPVQYFLNSGRRLSQTDQSAMTTGRPHNVGSPVDTHEIPDFWKPIEEWAVD